MKVPGAVTVGLGVLAASPGSRARGWRGRVHALTHSRSSLFKLPILAIAGDFPRPQRSQQVERASVIFRIRCNHSRGGRWSCG